MVKCLPAMWETEFNPWIRKIPWRRKWQSTPVLLPGKFHGQRSLVGYSPWGCKESDKTEQLHFFLLQHLCTQIILGADPHIDTAGSGVRDGMAGSWAGCSQQGEVMSSLFNKVTSEEGEQSRLC